jgi:two-component system, OmpR family, response regulator VanR
MKISFLIVKMTSILRMGIAMRKTDILNVLYIQNTSQCAIDTVPLLEAYNYNVLTTDCIDAACHIFSKNPIDIILVDLELDHSCGLDFIHCLREKNIFTPTIITTKDIHKTPLLEVLNLEISNCLIHPYSNEDLLLAFDKASMQKEICHPLSFTDFNMGFSYSPIEKHIIASNGEIIKLTKKEALLIELLLQNKEYITSYEMIETVVWQDDFMSIDSLRTLIRGIRKKTYPNIITNHNSIGYKIDL